jgi:ABC-2 type transport system permease protein
MLNVERRQSRRAGNTARLLEFNIQNSEFKILFMRGILQHLLLTLRLNFRSLMPVIYGYLVPILFLIGFAAVFRAARPPLVHELGQLLTISALGGACFGMPTALVAERQRGIWRRYRLLPAHTATLILSTVLARLVLICSSAAVQIVLALAIYQMPAPAHALELVIAFLFVGFAFCAMGLVIAMLADSVPAVQALGQAIFLPMILIGGVGVPLSALPDWARIVAGFLPGRYAVQVLDATIFGPGLIAGRFSLLALGAIGIAAAVAGACMFRWDTESTSTARSKVWALAALLAWAAVGFVAMQTGRSARAGLTIGETYQSITSDQINSITFDDLSDDGSLVTPIVDSPADLPPAIKDWMNGFSTKLAAWPPGKVADPLLQTTNLLSVAAIADLNEFQYEGEVPIVVFAQLRSQIPQAELEQILAFLVLHPPDGVLTSAPELGIPGQADSRQVTGRLTQYARKLLGRLLGKLG